MNKKDAVVVTTEHRGVFFGYIDPKTNRDCKTIKLADARMCIYWDTATRGVMGLAATGPTKGCRIGPKVPSITLQAVTSVMEMTDDAAKAWEAQPWQI